MSKDNVERLYEATETGTLEDVKEAFEACSVDEREEYGYGALWRAADNPNSNALDMMEFLMGRGLEPDSKIFLRAAMNPGPCVFDIVKFLIGQGVEPHSDAFLYAIPRNYGSSSLNYHCEREYPSTSVDSPVTFRMNVTGRG